MSAATLEVSPLTLAVDPVPEARPGVCLPGVPEWRAAERTLLLDGQVVIRFGHKAPRAEALFALFQANGWRQLIRFEPMPWLETRQVVHQTIGNLNRRVRPYLHFWQECCGRRIGWEPLERSVVQVRRSYTLDTKSRALPPSHLFNGRSLDACSQESN